MKNKYCDKKWQIIRFDNQISITTDRWASQIAVIARSDFTEEEAMDNARLIAAAPELFYILMQMTDHISGRDSSGNVVIRIPVELSKQIGVVLRKAEGGGE